MKKRIIALLLFFLIPHSVKTDFSKKLPNMPDKVIILKKEAPLSHEAILKKLMKGNQRFYKERSKHGVNSKHYRLKLSEEQKPFAAIVCCSDSRVPPEIVFDQRLGRLFVIRSAGNVLDTSGIASLEYALTTLKVTFIMVLGHEKCGAVTAALADNVTYPGHIPYLIKKIRPAVIKARKEKGDLCERAVKENVKDTIEYLRKCKPIIDKKIAEKEVAIVGAYYPLKEGKVLLLEQ